MAVDAMSPHARPPADFSTDWFIKALHEGTSVPLEVMGVRLVVACGMGIIVAGVHYLSTAKEHRRTDRSFLTTLVLLSVLIALVTLVIGDSAARAFSLVGALAIVRFRTVVEDTRDTAFVIFSVAAGMATGIGYVLAALMCTPLVLLTALVLRPAKDRALAMPGLLILRLSAGREPGEELHAVIGTHLDHFRLVGLNTVRGGSAVDLTYYIRMPEPQRVFALMNALNRVEGVQAVEVKET